MNTPTANRMMVARGGMHFDPPPGSEDKSCAKGHPRREHGRWDGNRWQCRTCNTEAARRK